MRFMGYRRADGTVGTRNLVGVLSAVVCVNEVVEAIVRQVQGTARFTHHQGCCQTPLDIGLVNKALIGLGRNPNLHSVILISLGCESTDLAAVIEGIRDSGKRVEHLIVQETGGAARTTAAGILLAQEMVREASNATREPFPISNLVLGMKCGSSDTTSGLVPNPAIGVASDLLVEAGGVSILGEVTEFIGAEHILARHAANETVARDIFRLVERMEKRAMAVGEDIRGGQPTGGNIKGGLTTIEEKSLGAIAKAGSAPIQAVYEYGERPAVKGLVVMDSPGREPEILTGLAAAGCNVIVFATGRGAPQGFPFVPVLKITGSRTAAEKMSDHIDMNLSAVIDGDDTIPDAGRRVLHELVNVASGVMTKAEISGYVNSMDIYMRGPVI
ncbi:UxaA family hydrolase [Sporomusa termitida]|uniref:(2R)-sulfolactate sulfo-lyase subunit beta n=1 Tax=Sporomusa termitida TaxID=2377 RepID=A0A517E1K6_9FIRM|nr:UxaA family hydrolase [Sporomusa termitida]QDR83396.1 (2R)-sulfolactate sulfo-lyase subunit beta [Sporomusa termitida]